MPEKQEYSAYEIIFVEEKELYSLLLENQPVLKLRLKHTEEKDMIVELIHTYQAPCHYKYFEKEIRMRTSRCRHFWKKIFFMIVKLIVPVTKEWLEEFCWVRHLYQTCHWEVVSMSFRKNWQNFAKIYATWHLEKLFSKDQKHE